MRTFGKNKETGGLRYDPVAESSLEGYSGYSGVCGFGTSCRFNHHRQDADVIKNGGEEHPERIGQPLCRHYMTAKSCKFGSSCKYDHPKYAVVSFNPMGYPLRPGEKECSYYVKTGHCKFGATCKFDHPLHVHNHVATARLAARDTSAPLPTLHLPVLPSPLLASQPYEMFPRNWHLRTLRFLPSPYPYLQGAYRPTVLHPMVFHMPGWSPYPIHMSHVASLGIQPAVASGLQCQMSHLSATPSGGARNLGEGGLSSRLKKNWPPRAGASAPSPNVAPPLATPSPYTGAFPFIPPHLLVL